MLFLFENMLKRCQAPILLKYTGRRNEIVVYSLILLLSYQPSDYLKEDAGVHYSPADSKVNLTSWSCLQAALARSAVCGKGTGQLFVPVWSFSSVSEPYKLFIFDYTWIPVLYEKYLLGISRKACISKKSQNLTITAMGANPDRCIDSLLSLAYLLSDKEIEAGHEEKQDANEMNLGQPEVNSPSMAFRWRGTMMHWTKRAVRNPTPREVMTAPHQGITSKCSTKRESERRLKLYSSNITRK